MTNKKIRTSAKLNKLLKEIQLTQNALEVAEPKRDDAVPCIVRDTFKGMDAPKSEAPLCIGGTVDRPCELAMGYGTDHFGEGMCKYHYGTDPTSLSHRAQRLDAVESHDAYSRYSHLFSNEINASLAHFGADDDPLNLAPDIVLVRTMVERWINDYDQWYKMLVRWYEVDDFEAGIHPRPHKISDITEGFKIMSTLASMVSKEAKRRENHTVTQIQLFRIMNAIGGIIMRHVDDPNVIESIRFDMVQLNLPFGVVPPDGVM